MYATHLSFPLTIFAVSSAIWDMAHSDLLNIQRTTCGNCRCPSPLETRLLTLLPILHIDKLSLSLSPLLPPSPVAHSSHPRNVHAHIDGSTWLTEEGTHRRDTREDSQVHRHVIRSLPLLLLPPAHALSPASAPFYPHPPVLPCPCSLSPAPLSCTPIRSQHMHPCILQRALLPMPLLGAMHPRSRALALPRHAYVLHPRALRAACGYALLWHLCLTLMPARCLAVAVAHCHAASSTPALASCSPLRTPSLQRSSPVPRFASSLPRQRHTPAHMPMCVLARALGLSDSPARTLRPLRCLATHALQPVPEPSHPNLRVPACSRPRACTPHCALGVVLSWSHPFRGCAPFPATCPHAIRTSMSTLTLSEPLRVCVAYIGAPAHAASHS
ncbi:hypothetical protein EVG20_g11336 [Dentipellis fragilis]|uniref:Uncharacterized protein n=1 Tax=Dentipellis fragilis TaxID=205917 RepID=A0A4Y9XL56_9AGAM|nr:hypothetical protein EVG20_g11336 [Dentipellis fragilis]